MVKGNGKTGLIHANLVEIWIRGISSNAPFGAAKGEVGYGITDTSSFRRVDRKSRKGRK